MRATPSQAIKILALDLDDTLLDADLSISPANSQAIRAAEQKGVCVVLASGRAPEAMRPYLRQLGLDRRAGHLIAFNGSSILRSDSGEEEWGVKLDLELLGDIWDIAEGLGWPIQTYQKNEILYNEENEWSRLDHQLTGIPIRKVDKAEFLGEPRVKVLIGGDPELLAPVEAAFRRGLGDRANMFRSKPFFFEIMHPHADKGYALERLAGLLRVEREAVMAMGDAMNDAGMLRWAGWPVAMANALPAVKDLARWVTTRDHARDGVAEAVERFILRG